MLDSVQYAYDAAPAISVGRRDQQEDTVAADFADGAGLGFIVLADGMGGHSAGDVASKIVVTEVFSELKMLANDPVNLERNIGPILRRAVIEANDCVGQVAEHSTGMAGMGSTLVAPIVFDNRLYWVSVGDSPLYLFRGSRLFRLNEEHSLASQLAKQVARGEIDANEAAEHPDRSCLTSVLIGAEIPQIDCRDTPVTLRSNDILIAASDGLQFISEQQMAQIIYTNRSLSSSEITSKLLQSISDLDDPDQDNVSLCVLKVLDRSELKSPAPDYDGAAGYASPQQLRRRSQ
ncbi:MAG: protein phosphatase 2C domain-containing protein [Pseudomonadota bacterium]